MLDQSPINPVQSTGTSESNYRKGCFGSILGIIICIILSALFGCRSTRTVVELRDSIRTEVNTNIIYIPDTQYVTLPPQTIERITPDTVSELRTDYAISTAFIHNGLLHHTLTNTTNPIPVPVQHKETTRDSIVYREKEVPMPIPVVQEVEKPLTRWQEARIWIGNVVLIALALAAAVFIFRKRTWWLSILKRIFT